MRFLLHKLSLGNGGESDKHMKEFVLKGTPQEIMEVITNMVDVEQLILEKNMAEGEEAEKSWKDYDMGKDEFYDR